MNAELFGFIVFHVIFMSSARTRHDHHYHLKHEVPHDLSLWINEDQVRVFSGFNMKIYAIDNGRVSAHIKDPNFNQYLPVIPSEVGHVNFTWTAGNKKYYYNFDRLQSWDENILKAPTISIKTKGKIPREPKRKCINFTYNSIQVYCHFVRATKNGWIIFLLPIPEGDFLTDFIVSFCITTLFLFLFRI